MPDSTNPLTKALNLKASGIFRLLVVTTVLLGTVLALGAASATMLQGLYNEWHLQRSNSLTVYLPPEADSVTVTQLTQSLATLQGVTATHTVEPEQVRAWLGPVGQNTNLPLPTVVDITVAPHTDTTPLLAHVRQSFPMAEVDDHKPLLEQVSGAVRGLQTAMLGLGTAMLALMALLITLTTRTGLQAQASTLHLLVQLGATDTTLTRNVCQQVLIRTLLGYAGGTFAAATILGLASLFMPSLAAHLTLGVLLALTLSPLLLPLLAFLTAALTTRHLLLKLT